MTRVQPSTHCFFKWVQSSSQTRNLSRFSLTEFEQYKQKHVIIYLPLTVKTPMEIRIPTPRNFSFQRTIISHGWCELLPFEIERDKWRLTRVIDLGKKPPVTVVMAA